MKRSVAKIFLMSFAFASYLHADEHHATFIKHVFTAEAEKILQQESKFLDTEISRAPRPDVPAISHPIYPVGPLLGPQGPQGKQGPTGAGLPSCGPFKLLEAATAGDVVRLVPDQTNQLGTKAAIRKIKKGPLFDWATRAGGNSSNDTGRDIATDCQGNIYITGEFKDTVTFGNNITLVSAESSPGVFSIDMFVAKLNPTTGEWIWATRAGGSGTDRGNGIATDCQGNVYVTGQFIGTVTFGNNITLVSKDGTTDMFVAKLNQTTGEWVWATRAGDTVGTTDLGNSVATDCQGNVYVTGQFALTITFGNNITLVSKDGTTDIFVAKLNPTTGEWVWATRAGSSGSTDTGNAVATDCSGNVYVTGQFTNTATFGNNITLVSSGSVDMFVAKLNPTTGEWIWATRAGGSGSTDKGNAVATDCSGNVYVTGQFTNTATFGNNITLVGSGSVDMFVAKLNPTTGEWVWATRAGSSGSIDTGNAVATDCSGNVYVAGDFTGTATFGNNITLVSNSGTTDIFVAKLNSTTGEWVWATRAGGPSTDVSHSMATDCQGNVYVTGQFIGTVTFGSSITLVSYIQGSTLDLFVAKLIDDERQFKTKGILQESGPFGSTRPASFTGTVISNVFTSLIPAADYYVDSNFTLTSCCCKCSCCCDANFKFIGTACSPTELILRNCC